VIHYWLWHDECLACKRPAPGQSGVSLDNNASCTIIASSGSSSSNGASSVECWQCIDAVVRVIGHYRKSHPGSPRGFPSVWPSSVVRSHYNVVASGILAKRGTNRTERDISLCRCTQVHAVWLRRDVQDVCFVLESHVSSSRPCSVHADQVCPVWAMFPHWEVTRVARQAHAWRGTTLWQVRLRGIVKGNA